MRNASAELWKAERSGSNYCYQSELSLTVGLGGDLLVEPNEVLRPSGKREEFEKIELNQFFVVCGEAGIRKAT